MPSIDFLDSYFHEKQGNQVHHLVDLHIEQDTGPEELDLSEYREAEELQGCRLLRREKRQKRQKAGAHKAQTFRGA